MSRKYFGTDGVRGRVGQAPLTVDFVLRLASAAARVLAPNGGTVLVGKDTRRSGYMFESALEAGFVAAGVDVLMIGPLPTPGIAYLTQKFECKFHERSQRRHAPRNAPGRPALLETREPPRSPLRPSPPRVILTDGGGESGVGLAQTRARRVATPRALNTGVRQTPRSGPQCSA